MRIHNERQRDVLLAACQFSREFMLCGKEGVKLIKHGHEKKPESHYQLVAEIAHGQ